MTRRDFDARTKRNHGQSMSWLERRMYEAERLRRWSGFDPLVAREREAKRQALLGVVGSIFERDCFARSRFRAGASV